MTTPAPPDGLRGPLAPVLVVLLTGLAYLPSLQVPFIFDDVPNIVENPLLRLDGIPPYAIDEDRDDVPPHVLQNWRSRYVGYLSFQLDMRAHGPGVAGFHVVNGAIHQVNALCVFALVLLLFRSPRLRGSELQPGAGAAALGAALVFALHPIQTQAVTYIVQRFASLATLFYLLAVVWFVWLRVTPDAKRWKRALAWTASVASAVAAAKTKEIALTLPVMIALVEAWFFDGPPLPRAARVVPYALSALLIPWTFALTGLDLMELSSVGSPLSRTAYLATEMRVVATYLRLLVWPAGQSVDHDVTPAAGFNEPAVLGSLFLHVVVVLAGAGLLWRSRRGEPALRLVALGIAWFYVTLSIESGAIPIADVMFEHRVYLPSVGVCVATGAGFAWLACRLSPVRARVAGGVVAVALAGLAVATWQRNVVWRSPLTLWADAAAKAPHRARPHVVLGDLYRLAGRNEEALLEYERAVEAEPTSAGAQNSLAESLRAGARCAQAEAHYRAAVDGIPDMPGPAAGLAGCLAILGRDEEALTWFNRALRLAPLDAALRADRAVLLVKLGRRVEALRALDATLRLDRGDPLVRFRIASLQRRLRAELGTARGGSP